LPFISLSVQLSAKHRWFLKVDVVLALTSLQPSAKHRWFPNVDVVLSKSRTGFGSTFGKGGCGVV